jgi:SprT protein
MPKQEVPLLRLQDYLPEGSLEDVLSYLRQYKVQLTITRQRQSILGDYRHAHAGKSHRISVNGNLNKYSFLITLLHELAHLLTYERHGHRVQAHGAEWKHEYGKILSHFVSKNIFPHDVEKALLQTLKNPSASSCGDESLLRELHRYDQKSQGVCLVEQVMENNFFMIRDGRTFKKGARVRTRYKCQEVSTGKWYLFSGVYEVMMAN